jgi:hypothetical protein
MRTLTNEEVEQVSGGNLALFSWQAYGFYTAWDAGWEIGQAVNDFNQRTWGMSLGDAVYRQLN